MKSTRFPGIPDTREPAPVATAAPPEAAPPLPPAAQPITAQAAAGKIADGVRLAGETGLLLRGGEPGRAALAPAHPDPLAPVTDTTIATAFGSATLDNPLLGAESVGAVDPVSQYSPATLETMHRARETMPSDGAVLHSPSRSVVHRLLDHADVEVRGRALEATVALRAAAPDAGIKVRAALDTAREFERRR